MTGHAIISGFLTADAEGRRKGSVDAAALDFRSVALAVLLMLTALVVAMLGTVQIPNLVSESLALIASGLFPSIILGLFWRRMTANGAVAAMVTGFTVTGLYIAGVRCFPVVMFDLTGAMSDAAPGAVKRFADLKAALAAATGDDMRSSAKAALAGHAAGIVNWWGLKPAAIVLIGVPAGFLAGAIASLVTAQRNTAE